MECFIKSKNVFTAIGFRRLRRSDNKKKKDNSSSFPILFHCGLCHPHTPSQCMAPLFSPIASTDCCITIDRCRFHLPNLSTVTLRRSSSLGRKRFVLKCCKTFWIFRTLFVWNVLECFKMLQNALNRCRIFYIENLQIFGIVWKCWKERNTLNSFGMFKSVLKHVRSFLNVLKRF